MSQSNSGRFQKPDGMRSRCMPLSNEAGMTMVEMLVAITIFGILTTLAFTAVMSGFRNVKSVRHDTDLNEEARLVLNRISRELREASAIPYPPGVVNPDWTNGDGSQRVCGPSVAPPCFDPEGDVSVTFDVDFNGNGIVPDGGDPERLTYAYDRAGRRLLLQTPTDSEPILAGSVEFFRVSYRSSNYKCDNNSDGQVTWQELEAAPRPLCPASSGSLVGGISALDTELASVDQVIIDITVGLPGRTQTYRTKVDLRNGGG